jgi:hypothetical protein
MAELANVSVVHPRAPGSNLGTDRKYFLILFVSNLNLIYRVLTLEHYKLIYIYLYWPIMLDPTRHVAKNPSPQYVCGEGPSKNVFIKCIY